MLEKITRLIVDQDMCVLATVSENRPHCSLMVYTPSQDGKRIFMVTSRSTKKYNNLLRNSSVSLLIDDRHGSSREETRALTLTGTCAPMAEGEDKERARSALVERHAHLSKFAAHPDSDILEMVVESVLMLQGLSESYYEKLT